MAAVINRYGRRGSRGLRPFLLLPKVLAVGLYIGSLAAVLVIWLRLPADETPARRTAVELVGRVFHLLTIPAAAAAIAFGVALLLQHPRVFVRMRWMIVKLISVAVVLPGAHVLLSARFEQMPSAAGQYPTTAMAWGLGLAIAGSIWIIILGRHKPRLGQNPARRR